MVEDIASPERNQMTEATTPADSDGTELRATIESYGTRNTRPAAVDPDLQPYLDRVRKMDAIRDVKGNIQFTEREGNFTQKATALPPEQQAKVYRALDSMPNLSPEEREAKEASLVRQAITEKLGSIRGKTGVSPNSLPVHKEQAQIAMDVAELYRKRSVLQEGIDKVVDLRKVEDPVTGELSADPVYWLSDHTREKWQEAIDGLDRDIRLLVKEDGSPGLIGAKRLAAAEIASAKVLQRQADALAREQEAQALAAKTVREEQIAERAEVIAKLKRNDRS